MKVYTIQNAEIIKSLNSKGFYSTDSRFICDESFLEPYQWLTNKAKTIISGWNTPRPIWVWKDRPDLRSHRFCSDPENPNNIIPSVLITLEIPREKILFTDFDLWHYVLNRCPVPYTPQEDAILSKKFENTSFVSLNDLDPKLKIILTSTWDRIIWKDSSSYEKFHPDVFNPKLLRLQGITEQINSSNIINIKNFNMINTYKKKED